MMSDDDLNHEYLDESDACAPDPAVISAFELEEIVLLKRILRLRDPRPDPGIYRNPDSDGAARDMVELDMIFSLGDPRPLKTPWRPYYTAEDLFQDPSGAREDKSS